MKKITLVLALALLLSGFAFAEDAAYTLTGNASLTWGYDLDTEAHGFTNAATSTLTIPFVTKATATNGADPITGQISIADFEYTVKTGDATVLKPGSVTAKLLFPSNLYLQIAGAPSFSINQAQKLSTWITKDWADPKLVAPTLTSAGGFAFGMTGDLNFALKVGSTNKHTDAEAAAVSTTEYVTKVASAAITVSATTAGTYYKMNGDAYAANDVIAIDEMYIEKVVTVDTAAVAALANDYMVGLDFGYTVGTMATVAANVIYGTFQAESALVGLGFKATVTPITGLSVVLATDVANQTDVTKLDLMFTTDYTMTDLFKFGAGAYFYKQLDADPNFLDARVRFDLLAVDNLTLGLGVDMLDLIASPANDPMEVLIGAKLAYLVSIDDAKSVKPYANVAHSLLSEGQYINAGLEAKIIPLTTLTVDYTAGTVTANTVGISPIMGAETENDSGVVTVKATITY